MKVTEIWRYPVKTMAGEKLQRVGVGPLGIEARRLRSLQKALRSSSGLIPWIPKNPARGRISKEWQVIVNE